MPVKIFSEFGLFKNIEFEQQELFKNLQSDNCL